MTDPVVVLILAWGTFFWLLWRRRNTYPRRVKQALIHQQQLHQMQERMPQCFLPDDLRRRT